jgi:hypothetical protein
MIILLQEKVLWETWIMTSGIEEVRATSYALVAETWISDLQLLHETLRCTDEKR